MSPAAALELLPGVVVASCLGLIFGSFANVCIHRLPLERSLAWPGSACPACGAPIAWYDNVPVLSWLLLAGRCRGCRAPIHWRYPLVEALTALIFVQLWLHHGLTTRWAALCWLALSIIVLVPIDWKHGILPDRVTIPGIVMGLIFAIFTLEPGGTDAMLGAAVGGLVPLTIRGLYMVYARLRRGPATAGADDAGGTDDLEAERREGMGLGDVKMLAMVGAFLGVSNVLLTMLLGSVIGSLYVVPLVAIGRHHMKTAVPFGPFLGVAALFSMFWGRELIDWYANVVVTLPLGTS